MNLRFVCKTFDELSLIALYRLLQIRSQVFNVEQRCDDQDLDDKDQDARHLCIYDGETLCAYARLLPPGVSYREMSIGRVAVAQAYRRKNIGRTLMESAIENCYRIFGEGAIKISAQAYLQQFYESLGFRKISDIYAEAGIEHIKMIKEYV